MSIVDGDETGAGSAGLYVALLCALSEVDFATADNALALAEIEIGPRTRCDVCAFRDTCVKRALAGGLLLARAWVVRTERQSIRLIGR